MMNEIGGTCRFSWLISNNTYCKRTRIHMTSLKAKKQYITIYNDVLGDDDTYFFKITQ